MVCTHGGWSQAPLCPRPPGVPRLMEVEGAVRVARAARGQVLLECREEQGVPPSKVTLRVAGTEEAPVEMETREGLVRAPWVEVEGTTRSRVTIALRQTTELRASCTAENQEGTNATLSTVLPIVK